MTVIGIGGCAALIVTAFGLRDSIFAVMEKQYEEIYRYSAQLGLVEHITPGEWAEVEKSLEGSELAGDWTKEHTETVTAPTMTPLPFPRMGSSSRKSSPCCWTWR